MIRPLPVAAISLPIPFAAGPVSVYLIREDPVTLVDTGLDLPDARAALLEGLQVNGVTPRDIRRVLLTHAHPDHHGLAGWIQAESGAEVWVHPDEAGKLDAPQWWLDSRERTIAEAGVPREVSEYMERIWLRGRRLIVPLNEWRPLQDGQVFEFSSGALRAVHLPGHSLGHTCFLDDAGETLLGGDHLLDGVTPNPIMEPLPPGHTAGPAHAPYRALTLGQFLESLDQVIQMPVKTVLPGHGKVITDHRAVARGYIGRHERRLDTLLGRLGEGITAHDLTRAVYPNVRDLDSFLSLSEVLAHLDLLVVRGRAAVEPATTGSRFQTV